VQGLDYSGENRKKKGGVKEKPSSASVIFNITAICDGGRSVMFRKVLGLTL
jgi:hypothetical protein